MGAVFVRSAVAAPGDITYKPALGKLGEATPFKRFYDIDSMTVDPSGRVFVYDSSSGVNHLVRFNSDGSNPVITADATDLSSPFGESNSGNANINNLLVGSNKLYGFNVSGINIFNSEGQFESYIAYPQLSNDFSRAIASSSYYHAATNELFVTFVASTPAINLDPSTIQEEIIVEKYSASGQFIQRISQASTYGETPAHHIVGKNASSFNLFIGNHIVTYDANLAQLSNVTVGNGLQSAEFVAKDKILLTDLESDSTNVIRLYATTGQLLDADTIPAAQANNTFYTNIFDDQNNYYEITGDPGFRSSFQKYDTNDTLIFEYNDIPRLGILQAPTSVATDQQGNTFVYDSSTQQVQKYAADGTPLLVFGGGGTGPGQNSGGVYDIEVDSVGNVYMLDVGFNKLFKFTSSGQFVTDYDLTADFAVTQYGAFYGKFDIDTSNNFHFMMSNGVARYDSSMNQTGGFVYPNALSGVQDIAIDRAGNYFILDVSTSEVIKYNNDGDEILRFGGVGTSNGEFNLPYALATDLPGNVYVADVYNHRVQKFGNDGEYLLQFGSSTNSDQMYLGIGYALTVDNDYDVLVGDGETSEVKRFEIEKNDSSIISADGRKVIDNPAISKMPTFAGATEPYAKVTVTVHSDPVSCEATADAYGNWSCTLPTELPSGQHSLLASIALANNSTLDLGPYPVHVIGALGTPGTTLGEGLFAPNTGLLRTNTGMSVLAGLSVLTIATIATLGVTYRKIKK